MTLFVLTISGRNNWLASLARQLRKQPPPDGTRRIALVGNDQPQHAEAEGLFEVLTIDSATLAGMNGVHVRRKMAFNYRRALGLVDDDVLILEDDILLTRNFWPKLDQCIKAANGIWPDHILTLYAPGKLDTTKPVTHLNPVQWWGSQGVFVPRRMIGRLFDAFREEFQTDEAGVVQDLIIKRFCTRTHTPLFAANPNLVQHLGKDSSGTTPKEWMHTSPSFKL